ncbi:DUF1931 domain-containing protein [Candidatus Woesearchaeota archaeon ex4484_78]|nr:MAG: DUF1931 domain-containing protein [Candidatus Woesearchaeota archaeon ex4484_78]
MGDIIVRSKIKEYAEVDGTKFQVASDFADALAKKVEELIKEACRRAQANGRKTVMGKDL